MIFTRGLRVCLAVEPVDLRRGFEGLALLVRESLHEDERSSQLFVFTNRRRDRVRLLYWDGTGTWILTKRLERGRFNWQWPQERRAATISHEALSLLLGGIDLRLAKERKWYRKSAA